MSSTRARPDLLRQADLGSGRIAGEGTARQAAALVVWVLAVAAVLGALHIAGRGALAAPALRSPSTWESWLAEREPVVAAFALVRLLAMGGAGYVAAITLAALVARLGSRQRLVAAVDRLTVPPLRRLLAAMLSVGLGTGTLSPTVAGAATRSPATVVAPSPASGEAASPPTITMRRLPPSEGPSPPVASLAPVPPRPTGERTWTVEPGQCFWSIAEAVVGETLGRRPSAREVAPYWQRLVEANRPALADPANPDLVFPGQVFTVPDP